MITKILLKYFVISIFIVPVLIAIGYFLKENYYGVGKVIGVILYDIGVVAFIIDVIIIFCGFICGTIKLIWE